MAPRWLDEDQQRAWRAFLGATQLLFHQLDRELQRETGIGHPYYEILVRLSEAPDRTLRMGELATATRSSPSRLSHAIARLEEAGWVVRTECPSDRRGHHAVLTDEGFRFLEAAAPIHVEGVRRHLVDQLSPEELAHLGAISQKVLDHLEAQQPARPATSDRR